MSSAVLQKVLDFCTWHQNLPKLVWCVNSLRSSKANHFFGYSWRSCHNCMFAAPICGCSWACELRPDLSAKNWFSHPGYVCRDKKCFPTPRRFCSPVVQSQHSPREDSVFLHNWNVLIPFTRCSQRHLRLISKEQREALHLICLCLVCG
jgi:hypothetical protein